MKYQCDKHGCSELLCGCLAGVLEEGRFVFELNDNDVHEILKSLKETSFNSKLIGLFKMATRENK